MGTWSHEPFGNDIASDWAYEFEENDGYEVIEDAFDQIIDMATEEFIDADIGCIAHAAAEVLAKSFTDGVAENEYYPEPVEKWLQHNQHKHNYELIPKALLALNLLISENSELDELWQDSDDYEDWTKNIAELKETLKSKV
ncbi:DUF4259 domain-containing protein [Acinetobacter sp.]|jgi:hypothetical protein|uniref:DUF4259 domain-containing protein n=1 Tax=Acinetobacter sp. TaxID=472 RepID=UPI00281B8943|nr:DUF4259 domain-containing protein [Acinetobacter sp.]MDR0237302.1 DUF4259 domain-containing protein [Acinetobacter sp.]